MDPSQRNEDTCKAASQVSPGTCGFHKTLSAASLGNFRFLPQNHRHLFLLLALVGYVLAWDVRAVMLDQRFRGTDNFSRDAFVLDESIHKSTVWEWFTTMGVKGPLGAVFGFIFLRIFFRAPLAVRLVSVFSHGLLTIGTFSLGASLGGEISGLWAALVCSTQPLIFGLCRLTHHDVLLAVAVTFSMLLLLHTDMERRFNAFLLGLVSALGMLVKVSYSTFMIWPVFLFLLLKLRSMRALINASSALAFSLFLFLPWAVLNLENVIEMTRGAYLAGELASFQEKTFHYSSVPCFVLLLSVATVTAIIMFLRMQASIWLKCMYLSYLPMIAAILLLNPWPRYLMPVYPLLASFCGVFLTWIHEALPPPLRSAAKWGITSFIIVLFSAINLLPIISWDQEIDREHFSGMIQPDQRSYGAFPNVMSKLTMVTDHILLAGDSRLAFDQAETSFELWYYRNRHPSSTQWIDLSTAKERHAQGKDVYVVFAEFSDLDPSDAGPNYISWLTTPNPAALWLKKKERRKLIAREKDVDRYQFSLYRVPP